MRTAHTILTTIMYLLMAATCMGALTRFAVDVYRGELYPLAVISVLLIASLVTAPRKKHHD
jgi:hypothetical protein